VSERLRLLLAQYDLFVGDVDGNTTRVLEAARTAARDGADLVMLPELALSGYPPEDLLFHSGFRHQIRAALERLCAEAGAVDVVVGSPEYAGNEIFNAAALLRSGRVYANHRKQCLPNYKVFDEKRYFSAGTAPTLVDVRGVRTALLVCEDMWQREPAVAARAEGAELVLIVNASPWQQRKQQEREGVAAERVREIGVPLVYLNCVGGQDELVFDGNSFVMDASGAVTQRLPAWQEAVAVVELEQRRAAAAGARRDRAAAVGGGQRLRGAHARRARLRRQA
jgi:NAD+ synthase (glutamine-hydrolysing)